METIKITSPTNLGYKLLLRALTRTRAQMFQMKVNYNNSKSPPPLPVNKLSIQLLRQSWICYECVMCLLTHPSNPFGVEYLCVSPHSLCSLHPYLRSRYSYSYNLKPHFPSLISTSQQIPINFRKSYQVVVTHDSFGRMSLQDNISTIYIELERKYKVHTNNETYRETNQIFITGTRPLSILWRCTVNLISYILRRGETFLN